MKELELLRDIIETKLDEIRGKENKTLNDKNEYKELQERLVTIRKVENWIKEVQ